MRPGVDIKSLIARKESELFERFAAIDKVALENQRKVLDAFRQHRLTEEHFAEKTGYGLDDFGRETLDRIFASIFGAEAACVRLQLVSGTHALACAILGNLEPGDRFVCLTGAPYDSLEEVLGIAGDEPGSLKRLKVDYAELDLRPDRASHEEMVAAVASVGPARIYHMQKSRGYSASRPSYGNRQIAAMASAVRAAYPDSGAVILVDNCYGEFVEVDEPLSHGADLIAGSLIKNPGGGLAICGGYIAGREPFVRAALNRVTAPGVGGHLGLTFNQNRLIFQGLFMAPSTVASCLKGAALIASVLAELGLPVSPSGLDERYDIIQSIEFGDRQRLINFCRAIQRFSPVDAHVDPEPAAMPGYQDQVIMAGGTFIDGSTLELSADAPLREPYAAFLQGGLSYTHVKCCLEGALSLSASGDLEFLHTLKL